MTPSSSLEALRSIGLQPIHGQHWLALAAPPGHRLMRVTEVQRDQCLLDDGRAVTAAWLWPPLRLRLELAGDGLVVGDWVAAAADAAGALWVRERLPPRQRLVRREPGGRRQALVSQVDTALLVMACGHDFNLPRLDRYLALVQLAGIEPVVVLSQADAHPDPAQRVAAVRHHLGDALPDGHVLALDGRQPQAAQALAPWLQPGRTLVLLGSSGAGKSTLLNTLAHGGDAVQATRPARADDGRGRHTTTVRSLHRCAGGACVIDTPGLRGLQLDADEASLDEAFEDIARLAAHCRYRDCQHGQEPGCAVRDAVAPARLASYLKLRREARRQELDARGRREQLSVWKARSKATREVMRLKGR